MACNYAVVEKSNHLAVHGLFTDSTRAQWHIENRIPEYCRKGFFMDKTLTPCSFEVVPHSFK